YRVEKILNELDGVHIKHLRPGYFFQNFLSNLSMIKHMNILGGNFGPADTKIMLSEPGDIAEAAAEELQNLNFTGHSVRYIASDERTTEDIAKVLGTAIGKPDLPWVAFSDEQTLGGMQQAGLPEEVARNYTEMGAAIRNGIFSEDYWANRPRLSKTKLEDFAPAFAAAYNAS
ncbi:MAG: NAD-dependent dehydratase, partial [Flavisolibacter sp.]|nr:NAD-dependent dehydratase [Flavisolibacter sp.]